MKGRLPMRGDRVDTDELRRKVELERLRRAIVDLHGVDATHVRSEPVRETFRGGTVWNGMVGVFAIRGHPKATTAYAWAHETDDGKRRHVAVLTVPPVNSPVDAVRASIVAMNKKTMRET